MALILEAFPKVSRELIVKSGYISSKYSFSFHDNGVLRSLDAAPTDTSTSKMAVLKLEDQGCKWHPENFELIAECKSIISTPAFFFGAKGLVPKNAVLGVAVLWMAPDASIRGVERIGQLISNDFGPCEIYGKIKFPSQLLRGTLTLQTILYLKERGNPEDDEIKGIASYVLEVNADSPLAASPLID